MKAICDALATRYANMTPPAGETLRAAHGQAPHSMPTTPRIVFFPQDGEMVTEPGMWVGTSRIDLTLYLSKAPGDLARVETQRQKWLGPLLSRLDGATTITLAGSGVKSALPVGWEFTEVPYGGDNYDGIIVHLEIITRQAATFVP